MRRLMTRRGIGLLGLLVAPSILILLLFRDAALPPLWDGVFYLNMATHGLHGNPDLVAPYAYRPGIPLLALGVQRFVSQPPFVVFAAITAALTMTLPVLVWLMVWRRWRRAMIATIIATVIALSFFHGRFPLLMPSLVDVGGYVVMVAAVWAIMADRLILAIVLGGLGLLFKEFLAIPLILVIVLAWSPRRRIAVIAAGVLVAMVALPRLLIPVGRSDMLVDPMHHSGWVEDFLVTTVNVRRWFNIAYAVILYWLPTLMLLSRARIRRLATALQPYRRTLTIYGVLVLALALYGGTNIPIFVSYMIGAQIISLALLLHDDVAPLEIAAMLIAVAAVNRAFESVPSPLADLSGYLDFYGGFNTVITPQDVTRLGVVAALLVMMAGLRAIPTRTSFQATPK